MGNQNNNYMNGWNNNCDNGCAAEPAIVTGGCEPACAKRYKHRCACEDGCGTEPTPAETCSRPCAVDGTHIYFDPCDACKDVNVIGTCRQEAGLARTLDVHTTLTDVCPGRQSALGLTLTEVDENGNEYARGFRAVTVPAHNGRCNQDVQVDVVRFVLPEDQSLQRRRHFIVRTQHHYLDAGNIWNNSCGR